MTSTSNSNQTSLDSGRLFERAIITRDQNRGTKKDLMRKLLETKFN